MKLFFRSAAKKGCAGALYPALEKIAINVYKIPESVALYISGESCQGGNGEPTHYNYGVRLTQSQLVYVIVKLC